MSESKPDQIITPDVEALLQRMAPTDGPQSKPDQIKSLQAESLTQAEEIKRLREALEKAPHDENCNHLDRYSYYGPCDCWKSEALSELQGKEE